MSLHWGHHKITCMKSCQCEIVVCFMRFCKISLQDDCWNVLYTFFNVKMDSIFDCFIYAVFPFLSVSETYKPLPVEFWNGLFFCLFLVFQIPIGYPITWFLKHFYDSMNLCLLGGSVSSCLAHSGNRQIRQPLGNQSLAFYLV